MLLPFYLHFYFTPPSVCHSTSCYSCHFHLFFFFLHTFGLHLPFSLWVTAARFQFYSTTQNYVITYLSLSIIFSFPPPSFSPSFLHLTTCLSLTFPFYRSQKESPPHMPMLVNVPHLFSLTVTSTVCWQLSHVSLTLPWQQDSLGVGGRYLISTTVSGVPHQSFVQCRWCLIYLGR